MNTEYKRRNAVARAVLVVALMLFMMSSLLLPAHAELDAPVMLDNCDTSTWHGSSGKDYEEKTEGVASVKWTVPKNGSFHVHRTWSTPVNAEGANCLEFDMYISDPAGFYSISGGNSLEITSSGVCDVEETAWNLTSLEVEEGWNHISLSIGSGGCDLSHVNYMRFYALSHNNAEPYTIMIDNIQLVYRDPSEMGGPQIPDDYIIGTPSPETAIPVISADDDGKVDDPEGDPPQSGDQTESNGCRAMMPLGAGAVLLLASGSCMVLSRKKNVWR